MGKSKLKFCLCCSCFSFTWNDASPSSFTQGHAKVWASITGRNNLPGSHGCFTAYFLITLWIHECVDKWADLPPTLRLSVKLSFKCPPGCMEVLVSMSWLFSQQTQSDCLHFMLWPRIISLTAAHRSLPRQQTHWQKSTMHINFNFL